MQDSNSRKSRSIGKLAHAMGRLVFDNTGNTIAIIAAALIPITAMIGSGVDISRAYMAKSRMQSACDSAALAARRVMRNDAVNDTVTNTGRQFFNFNFPQGLYQTAAFVPSITRAGAGEIRISAETTIPTAIMHLFGFENLPISVSCEASLNFVNTDIVLVLDVTGSMLCLPSESTCNVTNERPESKIVALRTAVMALYDELAPRQAQLRAQNLRLRYGVVPYSSTVNIGRLVFAEDQNFIRNSTPYQTRVANYSTTATRTAVDTAITTAETGLLINPGTQRFKVGTTDRNISNANCTNFGNNTTFNQSGTSPDGGSFTATGINGDAEIFVPQGSSTPQGSAPAEPTAYIKYNFARSTSTWSNNPANRVCDRTVTVTRRTYEMRYNYIDSTYRQDNLDTSTFKTPTGTISLATTVPSYLLNAGGSYNMQQLAAASSSTNPTTVSWNGCIEERDTVNTITSSSGFTIPAGAKDLDVDLVPTADETTRWRPMLKEAVYQRAVGTAPRTTGDKLIDLHPNTPAWYPCPSEARLLAEVDREPLNTYINSLISVGGTYHDIGMIWGARLVSTGGIFADGCEEFNGMPCSRHLIFLTDGQQTAYCNDTYTAYGVERNDQRVKNSNCSEPDAEQLARHQQRFKMICNATKNMNVSVWVVAFATTLNSTLSSCASNSEQAMHTTTGTGLQTTFENIGNKIGALRLTE